ncbi:hypothetical protein BHU72_06450 [Desulfuribacillus stibiiarsenatis]|uniref:Rhodanese domain-containing protein n=1 Tax=Desulfuribacillus stibiiarsenatis TaxID=1390249 RepID=A0A1E5L551_9FIRM|nr:rhodanese-like domain-containing protein [Desulfuribacillus stibiiarsenatis]OEH85240.1 hypothetical protein BHU72_06450 [Desulfuribacillus stibiiarsenatis]
MNRYSLLFIVALVTLSLVACGAGYKNIDVHQANTLSADGEHVMLDVRTVEEYAEGHVPGTVNIPVEELESRLDELNKDTKYLVICRSGKRSVTASEILVKNGFKQVTNVEGGMLAWPYEVEK